MNKIVTSKEKILLASKELVKREGWNAISIRAVAKECNIAIGSIYNYFQNKEELASETVASIWQDIFSREEMCRKMSLVECIEWIITSLQQGEKKYPGFAGAHSKMANVSSRCKMEEAISHIIENIQRSIEGDSKVDKSIFTEEFSVEEYAKIIFSLIENAIYKEEYTCKSIVTMIKRTIYVR